MKEPIEVDDIREGMKIRYEYENTERAYEYRASEDGSGWLQAGQHYLIEPRKPAVELPSEPTLAWATWGPNENALGIGIPSGSGFGKWKKSPTENNLKRMVFKPDGATSFYVITAKRVTAFTPATAVPTEALDELRDAWHDVSSDYTTITHVAICLLKAVDGAK